VIGNEGVFPALTLYPSPTGEGSPSKDISENKNPPLVARDLVLAVINSLTLTNYIAA